MCVGSVCTHLPYSDKNPPSVFFFFIPINHKHRLRSSRSQILGCVTSHKPKPLPRLLIDTGVLAQTEWAVISPPLFRRRSRCRQECLPSDFVVRYNNEHSSHHLLPTSAEDAVDYFCFWRECAPDLPKCLCSHKYIFYESLQIVFSNNVLVSKIHDEYG